MIDSIAQRAAGAAGRYFNQLNNAASRGACALAVGAMLFHLSACAMLQDITTDDGTPATEATLISISADYLRNVATGNRKPLNAAILWGDYLRKNKRISKVDYEAQLRSIQGRWTDYSKHPLVGLDVVSVDVNGNNAKVIFKKANADNAPEIWIKYFWSGSGWLVVDDSLFGDGDQLFANLPPKGPA